MRLSWRTPNANGTYGEEVSLDLPEHDHAFLRNLWEQFESVPRTSREWSPLLNELRTLLDLYACFPGSALVVEKPKQPAPSPVPPAYLQQLALPPERIEQLVAAATTLSMA